MGTRLWAILIFLPFIAVTGGQGGTIPQPARIEKIAFVGNSITRIGHIYSWTGQWGMAATQPDRDYVHRTQLLLAARNGYVSEISVFTADLNMPETIDQVSAALATYSPSVLVVQMGDNADVNAPYVDFRDAYAKLHGAVGDILILDVGTWKDSDGRDKNIKQVAEEDGTVYVAIHDISLNSQNQASAQGCTDTNGVCWHPSDSGMAAIAARIVDAIR